MKIKVITTTSDRGKCEKLEQSLTKHGYDYHIIEHTWTGFLDKLKYTYEYLKSLEGYTHFIYTDAWDTVALTGPENIDISYIDGLILSAERNCYPYPEWAEKYPKVESPFCYVNGGGWAGTIESFIRLYESKTPTTEMNDQVWLTERYLSLHKEGWISLDHRCDLFQTIAFCEPERDFDLNKESLTFGMNKITCGFPIFWHGNGHTPMDYIYDITND